MNVFQEYLIAYGLSPQEVQKMWIYAAFLLSENEKYNLTRITEQKEMAQKHFIDSIIPEDFIPEGASVMDVGTGPGFPGIPLKIVRPDIQLTVLDSSAKKIEFVRKAAENAAVAVEALIGRAEELQEKRESFDIVVSRAVAALPILLELCMPLVKVGGKLLAYKGAIAEEELRNSKNALSILGCTAEIKNANLPEREHKIIVVTKHKKTASKFPRRYAQIKSSPL